MTTSWKTWPDSSAMVRLSASLQYLCSSQVSSASSANLHTPRASRKRVGCSAYKALRTNLKNYWGLEGAALASVILWAATHSVAGL